MAAQNVILATDSLGGYAVHTKLSERVIHAASPRLKFRQFTSLREAFGKNQGDTVLINKYATITAHGGKLTEGTDITATGVVVSQVSITVTELGKKIDYSSKLMDLANQNVLRDLAHVLSEDAAFVINTTIEADVFNVCDIRYVGTSTNGSALTTNGTATATNTSVLNAFHVEEIVDYLRSNEYPPYFPNGDYACIGTTKALRGLKRDSSWENVALYGDVERIMAGEAGRYQGCRFVEANVGMDTAIGVSGSEVTGEAYFFGADFAAEVLAQDIEVRVGVPTDLGRRREIGWVMLAGWGMINETHCVKWDSA